LRRYETVFILRPDLGEAQVKEIIKRFEGIVAADGGELIDTDEWGFRELAYRIRGERRGYYVRLDYAGPGTALTEIERNLKLADNVLRYLSVLVDPEVDTAKVRAEVEARRRRTAEAHAAAEARAAAAAEQARAAAAQEAGGAQETGASQEAGGAAPEEAGTAGISDVEPGEQVEFTPEDDQQD
jgi:small subunit ribosomal protein S6